MKGGVFLKVIKDYECSKNSPLTLGHMDTPIYGLGRPITPRYPGKQETDYDRKIFLPELLPLEEYDLIVVLFSGGKDSAAAYLKLHRWIDFLFDNLKLL